MCDSQAIGLTFPKNLSTLALVVSALSACSQSQAPTSSDSVIGTSTTSVQLEQLAYIKASNPGAGDQFGNGGELLGNSISLSGDGSTLAVGAFMESSGAAGINGDQGDDLVYGAGAVYVYARDDNTWKQQAYIKASNPGDSDNFGYVTTLSADGDTLVVSANFEASNATGVNGDQSDDSIYGAGAVYVFIRDDRDNWSQQAYIKASNAGEIGSVDDLFSDGDQFGFSISLSADGNKLAVGAIAEDSSSTRSNGDQLDNSVQSAGAVYIFVRSNGDWTQRAYIKPSNPSRSDLFGYSVALDAGGNLLGVGAFQEDGSLAGTNEQQDDDLLDAGAVYVFSASGDTWIQSAYLKAANAEGNDVFGTAVAISDDGNTLIVTALDEDGATTGVNSTPINDQQTENSTGAVYVFSRSEDGWSQTAYLKASNTGREDWFGVRVALSGDGNRLVVGAQLEDSAAQGVNGNEGDNAAQEAGAAYIFTRDEGVWSQVSYVKSSNSEAYDEFGGSVAISRDGGTIAVGARGEDSAVSGLNGNQDNNSALEAGAVYLFSY
ncbi:MAG: integrin [Pseudomonadota bacterium]|nr:integrin [Pseudomonadota bacterium]